MPTSPNPPITAAEGSAPSPRPIGIGVIGYGYWGPNLVRNLAANPAFRVVGVSDLNPTRLQAARLALPWLHTTPSAEELIRHPEIDAIAIATPVATHFDLALSGLRAGKHLFVEKPLTNRSNQASILVEEAKQRGLTLMIDHTFVYSAAVRKIKALLTAGELGDILYLDSARINLGLVQSDVNVLWDLAVHDLSIIQYLFDELPQAVSATGTRHIAGRQETIAYLTLHYASGFIAHCHVNWLSPVKVRRMLIGGTRKMVVYDDVEPSEKIRVYDAGINVSAPPTPAIQGMAPADYRLMIDYRKGDIWIPHLDPTETLKTEIAHLADCINNRLPPLSGGPEGLHLVRLLEAATQSLFLKGQPIPL